MTGRPEQQGTAAAGPARDPGLQPERTELAWRRTVMSQTVGALLLLHQAVQGSSALGWSLSVGAFLTAAVTLVASRLRVGRRPPPPPAMALVAALTAVTAVLGLVSILAD